MRILIGDLDDGLKQGEIASRLNVNRFRVARMMIEMQRQFGHVA
jgi:DNA-binding transcriptional regulator LsrR (DeoR family)